MIGVLATAGVPWFGFPPDVAGASGVTTAVAAPKIGGERPLVSQRRSPRQRSAGWERGHWYIGRDQRWGHRGQHGTGRDGVDNRGGMIGVAAAFWAEMFVVPRFSSSNSATRTRTPPAPGFIGTAWFGMEDPSQGTTRERQGHEVSCRNDRPTRRSCQALSCRDDPASYAE
jgi:hypothetical protein